jgi:hypothetical protein
MPVRITKPEINLREIINELDKQTGVAGQEMLAADTPQEQFKLIGAGRRNILINGDFQVSQRGDYTTADTAGNGYYLDRWVVDRNGTCTLQHTTGHDIPGSPAKCKAGKLVQTVAGNNYLGFRQKIEDPTRYVGRTITFSAWVRSNTSNARIEWYTQGTNQYAIGPSHSGNEDWEYLSFTTVMTGNPSTNWWVDVFIDNGSYSNTQIEVGDYIEVTMAQLEIGPVATPFEHRSYGEELALTQRYYQIIQCKDNNGNVALIRNRSTHNEYSGTVYSMSTMRTEPSVSHTGMDRLHKPGIVYDTVSSVSFNSHPDGTSARVNLVPGTNHTNALMGWFGAASGGSINFDAEL